MRKIQKEIICSVQNRYSLRNQRDELTVTDSGYKLALWGNIVAERKGNSLELCDCGWNSQTTASRINAVCTAEHLPLCYRYGNTSGGYIQASDGTKYISGHVIWDFSENKVVEE